MGAGQCDSDFDGIVDINDLESFLIDSMDCAGFQGPPPPEWLEDVIEYFIGRCGGCPGFDIDIEDIIDLLFRYYPGPIPPEIIDNIADLLNPPGEITPPVELPDNPPEIGDGSDGGGGGEIGGGGGDDGDHPGPGDGNTPPPPGGGGGSGVGGDTGGSGMGDEGGDGPDDGESCATTGTANPTSGSPVHMFAGDKLEQVVDLDVALPGRDFKLTRYYNGGLQYAPYGLVANGWTLSVFSYVQHPLTGDHQVPDTDELHVYGRKGMAVEKFEWDGTANRYRPVTGGHTYIKKALREWNSTTYAVWELVDSGEGVSYYFRTPDLAETTAEEIETELVGAIWQDCDSYDHVWTYVYDLATFADTRRLKHIRLNDVESSYPAARVSFTWVASDDEELPLEAFYGVNGRLVMAQVERRISGFYQQTAYVAYFHKPGSEEAGTLGDLVEVRTGVRMDAHASHHEDAPPWYTRGTHYRYHTNQDPLDPAPEDERLTTLGSRHQLRAVVLPEQVEWLAARMCETEDTTPAYAIEDALKALRGATDSGVVWTDGVNELTPLDLSAKIVGYDEEGRVLQQYVQTGCGCSGEAHGLKQVFSYAQHTTHGAYATTTMQELARVGATYELFRTTLFDMKDLGGIPYLINRVVEDSRDGASTEGDRWVWHYEYEEVERRLVREFYPSAAEAYTPADSTSLWDYEAREEVTCPP